MITWRSAFIRQNNRLAVNVYNLWDRTNRSDLTAAAVVNWAEYVSDGVPTVQLVTQDIKVPRTQRSDLLEKHSSSGHHCFFLLLPFDVFGEKQTHCSGVVIPHTCKLFPVPWSLLVFFYYFLRYLHRVQLICSFTSLLFTLIPWCSWVQMVANSFRGSLLVTCTRRLKKIFTTVLFFCNDCVWGSVGATWPAILISTSM